MNRISAACSRCARIAVLRAKKTRVPALVMRPASIALLVSILFPPAFARADIVTGLVDYWKFNETSGTVAFDSVGGNNANLSGFSGSPWVPGRTGNSIDFTAASNYVVTSAPISYSQYTLDFWVKVNGPGGINSRLVGPRDGNQTWIILNSESNRGVGFYYNHGANTIQDSTAPPTGVWENYAATIDLTAHTAAIYENGVQVALGAFTDNIPQLDWVFGHNQDPNNTNDTLNGQLEDVRLYDRILTQSDIVQLVPEPSGIVLAALGFIGLFVWAWRQRSRVLRCSLAG